MKSEYNKLFTPFTFKNGLTLRNKIVMAPMTTYSANVDGSISDEEISYYQKRVANVGLVLTGCTHVTANGIGFTDEFAAFDDRFIPSLKRLADAAKSGGAKAILQIFHAGNKAIPELIPNSDVVSASALVTEPTPFNPDAIPARELTEPEIYAIIKAFGGATKRAIEAGFDGVEIHGAHGFLIQNFLSPLFNQRTDQWGGSLENRLRLPLEILKEVKKTASQNSSEDFIVGYRISPEEPQEGGLRLTDTYALIDGLIENEVDFLHFSLYNILSQKPLNSSDNKTIAQILLEKIDDRVPTIAAGQVRTPDEAEETLRNGLSLVAIGQALVMNPDWVALVKSGRESEIDTVLKLKNVSELSIPAKLVDTIEKVQGWFKVEA